MGVVRYDGNTALLSIVPLDQSVNCVRRSDEIRITGIVESPSDVVSHRFTALPLDSCARLRTAEFRKVGPSHRSA